MSEKSKIKIGIFGAGTIGSGLINIIKQKNHPIEIVAVVDKFYKEKKELLNGIDSSDDFDLILKNDEIDLVVELIGGTEHALYIVREALDLNKSIVTANKALIAKHGYALFNKALLNKQEIGFEAAIAGAIPIIANLIELLSFQNVPSLQGILNGTSNYLLTKMRLENRKYLDVLKEAQELGLAEADPSLDVNGGDVAHKLALLASIITGKWVEYKQIYKRGIEQVTLFDVAWAEKMGYRIRLIAKANQNYKTDEIHLSIEPTLIDVSHYLWDVEFENNAIYLETEFSDSHLFVGKGAGSFPTAYSVLTDILRIHSNRENGHSVKQNFMNQEWEYAHLSSLDKLESSFYLRFTVKHQHGVLAQLTSILSNHKISIATVHQEDKKEKKDFLQLIIITEKCQRRNLQDALIKLDSADFVKDHIFMPID